MFFFPKNAANFGFFSEQYVLIPIYVFKGTFYEVDSKRVGTQCFPTHKDWKSYHAPDFLYSVSKGLCISFKCQNYEDLLLSMGQGNM